MTSMNIYQEVVPELISLVPEIKTKYVEMNADFGSNFTAKDVSELQQIAELHNLSDSTKSIGPTIVFENLLVPYVLEISSNGSNPTRLLEIMTWIEKLSNSGVFEISNLVSGSFCEPLVASNEDKLPALYPTMGIKTKELCKLQLSSFIVSDATRKMLGA
jgi:hypothetical protein